MENFIFCAVHSLYIDNKHNFFSISVENTSTELLLPFTGCRKVLGKMSVYMNNLFKFN